MPDREEKIKKLKEYFAARGDVALAFLFGSQAKGTARRVSDWDIGVYFTPSEKNRAELETGRDYPESRRIWSDVEDIVSAEVDLLVLNRARPALVFSILNSGEPLVVKNRTLYLRLLLKTHYEAVDFWNFVNDFWQIRERSHSLSQEDKANLIEHIVYLENELLDMEQFRKISQQVYMHDRNMKRNIERWVENLVMASLDISKIILSAEKQRVPETYKETLRAAGFFFFDEQFANTFAEFADLRNILAHEYLDLRWQRIQIFITSAEKLLPQFLARVKKYTEESK